MRIARGGLRAIGAREGFTALELVIAITIFAAIFSTFALATITASDTHRVGSARAELETRAHRVVDQIVARLDQAGRQTLDPQPIELAHTPELRFQHPADFVGGKITWDTQWAFRFRLEENEDDNGVDDDGDGLVDEGLIALVENPGTDERETVLCHGVREFFEGELENGADDNGNGLIDEQGLSFDLEGDVLRVLVTLERFDGEGRRITASAQTSVRVRN